MYFQTKKKKYNKLIVLFNLNNLINLTFNCNFFLKIPFLNIPHTDFDVFVQQIVQLLNNVADYNHHQML